MTEFWYVKTLEGSLAKARIAYTEKLALFDKETKTAKRRQLADQIVAARTKVIWLEEEIDRWEEAK